MAFVILLGLASSARAGTVTLAWTPSPDVTVTGYAVLYGTAPGVYSQFVYVGNQTTALITGLGQGPTYYFVAVAYSMNGTQSLASNEVSASAINSAPQVTSPGDQANFTGDTVALQIAASDPDGDPITYSATGLPPGLTIDANSGMITGFLPHNAAGQYPVTVTVSDGAAPDDRGLQLGRDVREPSARARAARRRRDDDRATGVAAARRI